MGRELTAFHGRSQVERDTVIIKQGQEARRLHIILSGECRVLIRLTAEEGLGGDTPSEETPTFLEARQLTIPSLSPHPPLAIPSPIT